MSKLPAFSVSTLLDAGVHFGHKKHRWNPKMSPYIYGIREDIHIIDLNQTVGLLKRALNVIYETVKKNGKILFVGTKVQASSIIAEYAEKCGQHYVNHRWLGGMLTNWGTISKSIKKLENLEKILNDEELSSAYTKKELLDISRKCEKLQKSLGGIRTLNGKPDLLVIIDTNKEHLAIEEAVKLGLPIIAIVDTNSDPDNVNFPIPGNDDAIRSIKLYCSLMSDTALAGIEDSLVASGVDIGALASNEEKSKTAGKVSKLKTSNKKISHNTLDPVENSGSNVDEFSEALEKNTNKISSEDK